jgi:hypothetical protein
MPPSRKVKFVFRPPAALTPRQRKCAGGALVSEFTQKSGKVTIYLRPCWNNYLNRLLATLMHEMVHLSNRVSGIRRDCKSRQFQREVLTRLLRANEYLL